MNCKHLKPTQLILVLLLILARTSHLQAVVVATTTGNTTAPADDPGWSNLGIVKNSTAIYLGNRWTMTASHVGPAAVTFPELGVFAIDDTTIFRLENPPLPGLSDETDIVLFQLIDDPGLPPLRIAEERPPIGAEVIIAGHGKDREEERTYWDVDEIDRRIWAWSEAETPPGDYSGFGTLDTNSLRWGTNLLEDDDLHENRRDPDITTVVETNGDVVALITEFDYGDGNSDETITVNGEFVTEYESQAVVNDSGGPLFYKDGDTWFLAGMAVAVDDFTSQPDVTRNPVFGNLSYFADLVTYRDQLETRFRYGDANSDGELTEADLDLMSHAALSEDYVPDFDLNRDGKVDIRDRAIWVNDVKNTFFGDVDLDGEFTSEDLIQVFKSAEYEDGFPRNSTWVEGDWDGDLEFTSGDFVVAFQGAGYEQGPRVTANESAALIPEPSGLSLAWLGLMTIGLLRTHFSS